MFDANFLLTLDLQREICSLFKIDKERIFRNNIYIKLRQFVSDPFLKQNIFSVYIHSFKFQYLSKYFLYPQLCALEESSASLSFKYIDVMD